MYSLGYFFSSLGAVNSVALLYSQVSQCNDDLLVISACPLEYYINLRYEPKSIIPEKSAAWYSYRPASVFFDVVSQSIHVKNVRTYNHIHIYSFSSLEI